MRMSRRQVLAAFAAVPFGPASASGYPERPVRVIVPFAPGGPVDVLARLIGEKVSARLGHQFYVENRGGAGGNIGMGAGAKAAPDGYTVTVVSPSFVVNPSLYGAVPYDPVKDFAPISLAAIASNILVVHPSLPVGNVAELVAYLRQNPGKYSFAHAGVGTTAHLAGELFRRSLNVDIAPVSFNGSAPAIQSTLGGHTPIGFTVITPAVALVKDGQLRALAVTAAKRSASLPDIPTLAELGFPEQVSDSMLGVLAPRSTSPDVIALLNREIVRAVHDLEREGRLLEVGFEAVASSPESFAERITVDIAKWARVIRDANLKSPQ